MQSSTPPKSPGRPSVLRYARFLIAVQVLRLIGLSLIPLLQNNTLPASFVIPTVIGDTSTAVTAPIIAYALGHAGPKTWAASLVWNGIGLADLFYAQTLAYVTGATTYLFGSDILIPFGAYLAAIFHIVTFVLLLEKRTVNQLLKP
ncbi:hypothetical protein E6H31_07795 [Candidatus Bathyarchaeota archaeon]|nr:MAG: hypothetical protein E6H31_07795 [Candidatus Bathyarchaeota archaeon]